MTARISLLAVLVTATALAGCATKHAITVAPTPPSVAPVTEEYPSEALSLDASVIEPMHGEMLAIDLPVVIRVATAQNIDILQARLDVQASQGRYDSAIGKALPTIAPGAGIDIVDGGVQATPGNILNAGFNTFVTFLSVDWVINPGQIVYEIIAARKRLAATEHQERAVVVATLRDTAVQYYELILNQSLVSTAEQALQEARELLRITELRLRTGTGILADKLRAEAHLAERQQDLTLAMNRFYNASVALAVTLRLKSSVTLVPRVRRLRPTTLVRGDLDIEQLLALAVEYRPDLASVRSLIEAADADHGAVWWGGFGPGFQASYTIGGIGGHINSGPGLLAPSRAGLQTTQQFRAAGAFRLSASTFGNLRTADAVEAQTILEGERLLDQVQAQVVTSLQAIRANSKLIGQAQRQVDAAEEALRQSQAGLTSGTLTTLDVLQAEDSVAQANLRYAHAVVGYNQSQVDLLASLGLVSAEALGVAAEVPPAPEPDQAS